MNLKELSQTLGLSQTTVSRALNGYPEVSQATRNRVTRAADQFNYRPNTRAQGLATGRAFAVGHVIPIAGKHEMVNNPIFGDFMAGAGETYTKNGYDMVLSIVEANNEAHAYKTLKARGTIDGVVVHAPTLNDRRIGLLQSIGLPFVVHGRATGIETPYSWLDVNNRRAFQRAADFLLDLGHRRIALINGLEYMDFAIRRRNGYEKALSGRGITADPTLMRSGDMTEVLGYRSTKEMMLLDNPPTAFLVASMICALGVRRAVEEQGLTIGRDVSIVTHDDMLSYLENGEDVPIFTATRSSVREAGRRVAQMVINQIDSPSAPAAQILLEADIVVGLSTGPASSQTKD